MKQKEKWEKSILAYASLLGQLSTVLQSTTIEVYVKKKKKKPSTCRRIFATKELQIYEFWNTFVYKIENNY